MSPPPRGSPPFGSGERRATRRYDLSLPIVVRVVPHKRSEPCHGRIRDISARGIYFIADEEFTLGAELEFIVALPVEITQGTEVSIHAHSRALRTEERREEGATRTGVAAVIEGIESIRAEPALS
jgi:PilZ domain